jgi:hypothetical protein
MVSARIIITRIRHYGFLKGCCRTQRLAQIRKALAQPALTEQAASKDSETPGTLSGPPLYGSTNMGVWIVPMLTGAPASETRNY